MRAASKQNYSLPWLTQSGEDSNRLTPKKLRNLIPVIDIHSHILRSVDDCCTSTRMSLDMLDALAAIGFSTIAATPDLSERLMPEFDAQVCEAYHQIATMPVQKAWR